MSNDIPYKIHTLEYIIKLTSKKDIKRSTNYRISMKVKGVVADVLAKPTIFFGTDLEV